MKVPLALLKSLADANRLRVVAALMRHDVLCACQLTEWLGIAGPSVSRHLQLLQQSGLLQGEKDGRWIYFRLSPDFPPVLRQWIAAELALSPAWAEDAAALEAVLDQNPSDLCRQQRERKTCDSPGQHLQASAVFAN
jgi:ArsR family transcriptional regulator, arsenate/arsenite/antimonite-responsive transcriptional repressor